MSNSVEKRLNGLALLYIHAHIDINVDNIIKRYDNQEHHSLECILQLQFICTLILNNNVTV